MQLTVGSHGSNIQSTHTPILPYFHTLFKAKALNKNVLSNSLSIQHPDDPVTVPCVVF